MALYRTVQVSFWSDAVVVDEFTAEDKYFYLYLLTNPHTNLCGCYEVSTKQIALELGYSTESVKSLINRFASYHNLVKYDEKTRELIVLNWYKYNWTSSPKFRKPLEKEIAAVKNVSFRNYLVSLFNNMGTDGMCDTADAAGNGSGQFGDSEAEKYGIDTVSENVDTSVTVTNTVPNTDTVSDNVTEEEQDFDYGTITLSEPKKTSNVDDVKRVLEAWNALGMSSTVTKITATGDRGRQLNARLKEYGVDAVVEVISSVAKCPFLKGENDKGWEATFDWIIRPNNFAKVQSGNYLKRCRNNGQGVGGRNNGNTGREPYPRGKIGITL